MFGEIAEMYDQRRPGWPPELIRDVIDSAAPGPHGAVLEIGAGTGKASVQFAECNVELTCVEPDPQMAAIARRNLAGFANVVIEQSDFEEWSANRSFDLVVCAQAWHWIDRDTRVDKSWDVLSESGAIALFWNSPDWTGNQLKPVLDDIHGMHAPSLSVAKDETNVRESSNAALLELRASDKFCDVESHEYSHAASYSSTEYAELLSTHSNIRLLPEDERISLLSAVVEAIEDASPGGVQLTYRAKLVLARRARPRGRF